MISAVLYRKNGRYTGFEASGHSGYAEMGSDIVCAGVSILGTTCVNAMESLLGVRVQVKLNKSGLLSFEIPALDEKTDEGVQLLAGALWQGLSDLQDEFPGYVKVEMKERRK